MENKTEDSIHVKLNDTMSFIYNFAIAVAGSSSQMHNDIGAIETVTYEKKLITSQTNVTMFNFLTPCLMIQYYRTPNAHDSQTLITNLFVSQ